MGRPTTAFLLLILAAGCSGPGGTVDIVSSTPASVTLEYTHSYSTELPAAVRIAEAECNRFRRHAALMTNTRVSLDRSVATFRCTT